MDAWKAFTAEVNGPRRPDHARSRARLGVTREVASLVQTPGGDFVAVFQEAEDIAKAFELLAASDDPYDVWFRQGLLEIHGLTSEQLASPPPAELVVDFRADGS
ncbi:hypothetical protein [Arthrobacter sp. 35W]|uniref:hypothetical protein n=1 Tax=Arthrobacter sp. 35W TaxID=1132441 RepID=UPI001E3F036A|nr:hypothetical protein [Arthrobacter sp. 35W]